MLNVVEIFERIPRIRKKSANKPSGFSWSKRRVQYRHVRLTAEASERIENRATLYTDWRCIKTHWKPEGWGEREREREGDRREE
uniref:Uncharacterized protein n=1 Tax=Physcomitrium patens TaxID=3218 RepID=A0A2K1IRV3_PHYPA|nr:hypothetical protein PHYPA_026134 [Physcomitrium patens]